MKIDVTTGKGVLNTSVVELEKASVKLISKQCDFFSPMVRYPSLQATV